MANSLYSVTAFTCFLVMLILYIRMHMTYDKNNKIDKSFINLIGWGMSFCLIDSIWGLLASDLVMNSALLFIFSTLFHGMNALMSYMWLIFILTYVDADKKTASLCKTITLILVGMQLLLLFFNIENHIMFYVDESGAYVSTIYRYQLFYMQYVVYLMIALAGAVKMFRSKDKREKKLQGTVVAFVASPVAFGLFQMFYPYAPANSIGYMLGSVIIYSFVLSNIIKERNIQARLAQQEQEKLERYRQEAVMANDAKTTFLFNMSHDIRTPMNAIIGFTAIAKREIEDSDKVLQCLNKIEFAGNHLLKLINDVLDMSRIETGNIEIQEKPLNIRDNENSVTYMCKEMAEQKDICLKSVYGNIVNEYIYADALHVNQVLMNVVTNAIKYTEPGGNVTLTVEELTEGGSVQEGYTLYRFTVEDTGIGMTPEFLEKIYDTFTREHSSTVSGVEGTGLGMSIVRKLVDLLGGNIRIDSEKGKGTKVVIEIPFRIVNEAVEADENPVENSLFTLKGLRSLLVEDNELNREIAGDILNELGVIFDEAENGESAVAKFKENSAGYYDFILMDVQMPYMDGYEATKAIRSFEKANGGVNVPIIAMTANAFSEDRKNALEAGMNDHIAKPVNMNILEETVKKVLAGPGEKGIS